MILLSWVILSASSPFPAEAAPSSPLTEINISSQNIPEQVDRDCASSPFNLFGYRAESESALIKNTEKILHSFIDSTLYFGAGTILGSAAVIAGVGWAACQLSPWASTYGNECLLSSHIFSIGALHSFAQVIRESPLFSFFLKKRPSSYEAWYRNQAMLSQIPTFSESDKELLHFLERRWLGKVTGSYLFVDWMCPSFGISLQVHPETTNSYARDPHSNPSETYKNRVAAWKRFLPHPPSYPLLLTRPSNIREYLPFCFQISADETLQHAVFGLARIMEASNSPIVVDITPILPQDVLNRKRWLDSWQTYEQQFSECCKSQRLDLSRVLCIHNVAQKDIGGIRLLPFSSLSKRIIEQQHQFLLEWISKFGLAANRIELDRFTLPAEPSTLKQNSAISTPMESKSKAEWLSSLKGIGNSWRSTHPQKTLMFKGIVSALQDLCQSLSQEKWEEVMSSPTRSHVVHLTLTKIEQQLRDLVQEDEKTTFYNTMSRIEQTHSDLSSLLEIFSPFTAEDFPALFREHLTSIPKNLQPLTEYGLHAAGMTTLTGICKAVERTVGRQLHILYGENTYYECIHVVERISDASMIPEATEENWKQVDLIFAQFNPPLKRIDFKAFEYHVEKISGVLHKALTGRQGRPLTIAVDCTLDFSDSPRIGHLLAEFQKEIERGDLNIICYRSPKFDLFGMENYCGAPFFMIHNRDAKWSSFDALLTDAALKTDSLSLNWFCLAYKNTAPYLENYKKQIFENTRAVLNRTPVRMFSDESLPYRVIPMDPDIDPSFIDIKISGPFHEIRGGLLVGVMLTLKCMEAGHPLLYRRSLGFYHPNLAVLFAKDVTTVRLTLGLDPSQIDIVAECLERIDALNGKTTKPKK